MGFDLKEGLVCIIGPDGVGKTTQARLLQKRLQSKGISAAYIWIRWNHLFSLPILGLSKLLKLSVTEKLPSGKKVVYHYFNKIKPIAVVYQFTFLIDTLIALLFKVYLRIWASKFVISDRSIYDAFIDLSLSTRDYDLFDSFYARVFLSFACGKTIMLSANSTALRERREDVSEDRDIEQKAQLYKILSKKCHITQLNAEKSIPEVSSAILQIVMPL